MLLKGSSFKEAKVEFKTFLVSQNASPDLIWFFYEDVLFDGKKLFGRRAAARENEKRVEEIYLIGCSRGLGVLLHGFASIGEKTCCFIEIPSDQYDSEALMMSPEFLKCSVRTPLRELELVKSSIIWKIQSFKRHFVSGVPSRNMSQYRVMDTHVLAESGGGPYDKSHPKA